MPYPKPLAAPPVPEAVLTHMTSTDLTWQTQPDGAVRFERTIWFRTRDGDHDGWSDVWTEAAQ